MKIFQEFSSVLFVSLCFARTLLSLYVSFCLFVSLSDSIVSLSLSFFVGLFCFFYFLLFLSVSFMSVSVTFCLLAFLSDSILSLSLYFLCGFLSFFVYLSSGFSVSFVYLSVIVWCAPISLCFILSLWFSVSLSPSFFYAHLFLSYFLSFSFFLSLLTQVFKCLFLSLCVSLKSLSD